MKRVEQHVIEKTHLQFQPTDEMALASKNLWNLANYHVRQSFIFQHVYLDNTAIFHRIKRTDAYQALPAKVANQLYNKQREHAQKQLAKGKAPRFTSHRLDQITTKRNRRVMHYIHTASRRIVELLVTEGIGTLVLGKNPFWKTCVALGKKNNQEFVQIPHAKFLETLTYKAQARGIRVIVTEESYTM